MIYSKGQVRVWTGGMASWAGGGSVEMPLTVFKPHPSGPHVQLSSPRRAADRNLAHERTHRLPAVHPEPVLSSLPHSHHTY
jgi:hypothetical protein